MLAVVQHNLSVLLSAMEKSCTTRTTISSSLWHHYGICCCSCYCPPRASILERWPGTLRISVWPPKISRLNHCSTFPRQNSICPSGSCCSLWAMLLLFLCMCKQSYGTAFSLLALFPSTWKIGEERRVSNICACMKSPWLPAYCRTGL